MTETVWYAGRETIESMLETNELEKIPYDESFIEQLIKSAKSNLKYAVRNNEEANYDETISSAYEGMRFYAMAYLAKQGLRATSKGGHVVIEDAIMEQSNRKLHFYGLRVLYYLIDNPRPGWKEQDRSQAEQALADTKTFFSDIEKLIDKMPMF